jgi:hypothetical protein
MISTIPFEIPAQILGKLATGEAIRYGTLLKDSVTGQILGHVQETGVAQSILSSVVSGGGNPIATVAGVGADLVNAGASIYAGVQVAKLKAMMETLQSLQVATLGISLVGVGISVAGFYYMHKRFNKLEDRMDRLTETIQAGFQEQRQNDLRSQMARTKGYMQRAQHAQKLFDPRPEYSNVAAALADQAAYFEGEIAFLTKSNGPINPEVFWHLAQMLMLCNNVRIDCGMRTNELRHTLAISESVSSEYNDLFTHLTPLSFGQAVDQGLASVRVLRDASDAAASKPYLIDSLRTQRISGSDYIESLEQEKDATYLLLKTGS